MLVLFKWICMHLLADFIFQSKSMVAHKKEYKAGSWKLYLHCLLHALLIYIITGYPNYWIIPVIIFITHYIIDLWKLNQKNNLTYFIIDQVLHILVFIILWLSLFQPSGWLITKIEFLLNNRSFWIIAAGYLLISLPLSFFLGFATQRWRREVEEENPSSKVSLSEAGKWIGIFERILIYTFVITNHFEGIGFLIAAKSILRFTDIKGKDNRKEAEYVLIGTLMSFSICIIIGLISMRFL